MAYSVVESQPPLRDEKLHWEEAGPGLYDDGEVMVKCGTIYATVSFVTTWLENGGGLGIVGTARWCKANGETELTDAYQHVETTSSITISATQIEKHGVAAFAKEALLCLLGEPPALVVSVGDAEVPVVMLSEEARLSMSIVNAAKTVKQARSVDSSMSLLAQPS